MPVLLVLQQLAAWHGTAHTEVRTFVLWEAATQPLAESSCLSQTMVSLSLLPCCRSPAYFGPEPTPPHSPSQPVVPSMWTPHDPCEANMRLHACSHAWPCETHLIGCPCMCLALLAMLPSQQPAHQMEDYN